MVPIAELLKLSGDCPDAITVAVFVKVPLVFTAPRSDSNGKRFACINDTSGILD